MNRVFSLLLLFLSTSFISLSQIPEEKLLSFIAADQHDTTRVLGYVELAKTYRTDLPEKAIYYMDQAEMLIDRKLSESSKHKDYYLNQLTKVHNVGGVIYRNFGNYPEALKRYKMALELLESVDNEAVLASTLFNVGMLNEFMENPQESKRYYGQSAVIRQRLDDTIGLVNCYRQLGKTYYKLGNYTAAIESIEISLGLARESNEIRKIFKIYSFLADVFIETGRYDLVKDSMYAALEVYQTSKKKYPKEYYRVALPLAKALYELGEINEGLEVLEKSIKIAKKVNNHKTLSSLYFEAAEGYQKKGDYKNAHRYLMLRVASDKIIRTNSNSDEVVRIEMNYLFKKQHMSDSLKLVQESEISRLKIVKKNAALDKGRLQIAALIIGVLLLSILGFVMYRNYRLKRKALVLKEKDVANLSLKIKRESEWIDNLVTLNDKIKKNKVSNTSEEIQNLVNSMRDNLVVDKHRQVQAKNIEVVTNEFRDKLKASYPELTKTEIEMCELIRLELSNSEISRVRNISQNSARMARYRLKKKLNLEDDQSVFDVLKEI